MTSSIPPNTTFGGVAANATAIFFVKASFRRSVLTASLVAIAFALAAIVTAAALYNNDRGMRDLKQTADVSSAIVAQSLEALMARQDPRMAGTRLGALSADPSFSAAQIRNTENEPILTFSSGPDHKAKFTADERARIPNRRIAFDTVADGFLTVHRRLYSPDADRKLIGYFTAQYSLDLEQRRARLELAGSILGAVFILALVGLILHLSLGHITSPLEQLAQTVLRIADGDLSTDVASRDRMDEIGALGRAIQFFKERLAEREALQLEAEAIQSRTDKRRQQLEALLDEFRLAVADSLGQVRIQGDEMTIAATHLAGIATRSSRQAHEAASAITESSANVRTVARASEELSASISEIGRQVTKTRRVVADAALTSAKTRGATSALAAKAEEIGEIIGLIQTIAEKTNMLALNATIEAVRAGEAGRGFAVVAQEVKSLASQTTKAAQHIGSHALAIQAVTDNVVDAITSIAATMSEAQRATEIIAVAVQQQSTATTEISYTVAETAAGTETAADNVGHVAASAAVTDLSADKVHRAAANVVMQAKCLSATVDGFLRNVAAL
jgi:methyl-accepting chemotaxis protein